MTKVRLTLTHFRKAGARIARTGAYLATLEMEVLIEKWIVENRLTKRQAAEVRAGAKDELKRNPERRPGRRLA